MSNVVYKNVSSVIVKLPIRTPADQARIMYDNITTHGVESQKNLYGPGGDKIIAEYSRLKKLGKNIQEIKKGMEDKINEVGPTTVSKHCCNPSTLSIFDVAPSSIPSGFDKAFENAIKNAKTRGEVSKYFIPPPDPAYHIEINL